jgi:hypothetical protein
MAFHRWLCGPLLSVLLLATGCSWSPGGTSSGDAVGADEFVVGLTLADEKLLWDSEQELIRQCMAEKGFVYAPRPFREPPVPIDERAWWVSIDPITPSLPEARSRGYQETDNPFARYEGPGGDVPGPDDPPQAESDEFWTALNGGEGGRRAEIDLGDGDMLAYRAEGCETSILDALYGDVANYVRAQHVVSNLGQSVNVQIRNQESYQAATVDWRDCMSRLGYSQYDEQYLAYVDGMAKSQSQNVSIATADATCLEETDYRARFDEAERRARAEVIERQYGTLTAYLELTRSALDRSREFLGGERDGQ